MFKGVNKVIQIYIWWDLAINSAWGLLGPVFAIFLLQNIAVGNLVEGAKVAGFATLCYWVTKAILQIPIGIFLDDVRGERDDFWFYITGTIITGLVPFGFLFSHYPWHIYVLEIIHGIGMSMVIPSSYAIFVRHVDKGKEAYEGGLDSTLLGLGAGIAGAIGGILAGYIGFQLIFILTGVFTLVAALLVLPLKKHTLPRVSRKAYELPNLHDKPRNRQNF